MNTPLIKRDLASRGTILIIVSALMFGSYGVWSRLLGPYFDNFFQGWVRAVIIFLILLPIVIKSRKIVKIAKSDIKWLIVFGLFTAATQAPIYYAFNHMDVGTATLLFYVTVLITMYIIGFIFLGEKLNRIKWVSFIIALIGLYVVFSFSITKFTILAASMAVLNGIASGGELAFSKKLSDKYSALYLTEWSWLAIAVTSLPLSLFLGERQIMPAIDVGWLYLLGYAIASLFGFWLVIAGLKYIEASIGGLLGLLEILFSIGFGIFLFHEQVTLRIAIGAILILCAAALPNVVDLIVQRKKEV